MQAISRPHLFRPRIGVHLDSMAASEIRAIDQQAADAGGAHFTMAIYQIELPVK
jgi:hypothetical protein